MPCLPAPLGAATFALRLLWLAASLVGDSATILLWIACAGMLAMLRSPKRQARWAPVLLCCLWALSLLPDTTTSAASPTVSLYIDATAVHPSPPISPPIPPNFQGLSIEWWAPRNYTGPSPTTLHTSFQHILTHLSAHPTTGPTIRIGGATTDESYYAIGKVGQPDWYNFAATTVWTDYAAVVAVARAVNATLILGINFRLGRNLTYTMAEVDAIANVTGGLQGVVLELGNEPELYECHTQNYRPCGWTFDDYMSEWDYVTTAILAKYPNAPSHLFQAGAFSGGYIPQLPGFVIPRQERIHSASFHRYAYPTCSTPLTVDIVLSDAVALPALLQPIAGGGVTYQSVAADITERTNGSVLPSLGEYGMMWCLDGDRVAMDTFAAALWVVDYNLAVASLGVASAVYYMGWQPPPVFRAAPFIVPNASVDAIEVLPVMYGMWLFALATTNHARFINTTRTDSSPTAGLSQLKTWTLRAADDDLVIVAIHKHYNAATSAVLAIYVAVDNESPATVANVVRLTAPSVASPRNISLAGLTWEGTMDGRVRAVNGGGPVVEPVSGVWQGGGVWLYSVEVQPGEAVLLSIPKQNASQADADASWDEREQALLRYARHDQQQKQQPRPTKTRHARAPATSANTE